MLYRLRHKDGSIDPYSSGSYVDASGKSQFLSATDFAMTPAAGTWTSPATKATYPVRWHVSIPRLKHGTECDHAAQEPGTEGQIRNQLLGGSIDVAGPRSITVTRSRVPRDGGIRGNGRACHPQLTRLVIFKTANTLCHPYPASLYSRRGGWV